MDTFEIVCQAGNYVVVEAVPGAGKTHIIIRMSRLYASSLILAYNNALASEIQSLIDPERAICLTFHALCSRYIRVVRDDTQLRTAVEEVESGTLLVSETPSFSALFIDEAQDVRPVYIRLLKVLGYIKNAERIYVFGDRNQLIYDYDDEFPACLDVLDGPNSHVRRGVEWTRVFASVSRRLTTSISTLVSDIFGVSITGDSQRESLSVEIRAPVSMFNLSAELDDMKHVPHLLLVDQRSNNRPLQALLNAWSRDGVKMNVHKRTESNDNATMTCATYWSAKGLQHDTAVVIVPECTPRNPLYVALTRALRRLIIVIDPKGPHVGVCQAAVRNPDIVSVTRRAMHAIASTQGVDPSLSLTRRTFGYSPSFPAFRAETPRVSRIVSLFEDDTRISNEIILDMALAWTEIQTTGFCRHVEDIFQPLFLSKDVGMAIRASGFVGRIVPPNMTEDMLLSYDLRMALRDVYTALCESTVLDAACILNLHELVHIKNSHFDYECVSRQRNRDPVITPFDLERIEWVQSILSDATTFDIPLASHKYQRVQACTEHHSYHIVSQVSSDDYKLAALRCASDHSCVLVDIDAWSTTRIHLE